MEAHVIFQGKVQGVGFRATVCQLALNLGVKGTVRNVRDGSVEMYAQADKATLEKLIQQIQHTFERHISLAQISFSDDKHVYDGFQVVH